MALPTLTELKSYLRIEHTAEDTLLTAILTRATAEVRHYLDRPIESDERTYTDRGTTRRAYAPLTRLLIPDTPVETSSPAPVITDVDGDTVDSDTYTVDGATGEIIAERGESFGNPPYTIVATTGLAVASDYATRIEPLIASAIIDRAADLYQNRNPRAQAEGAGGGVYTQTNITRGLPPRIAEMIQSLRRVRA